MDQLQALFHLLQSPGIELDSIEVGAQVTAEFSKRCAGFFQLVDKPNLLRVNSRQRCEKLGSLPQQLQCGWGFRRAFIQDVENLLGVGGKHLRVCQAVALLFQFLFLAGLQTGGFNFLRLKGEQFLTTRGLPFQLT